MKIKGRDINRPKVWSIVLVGLAALFVSACGGTKQEISPSDDQADIGQIVPVNGNGNYVDIIPSELNTMLEDKDFFFVNVHIPYEGELPETDAFIPYNQIADYVGDFPESLDSKIVLYCRSGSMSSTAARSLVELGYTNVYNLDGGFRAWASAGYDFIAP